MSQQIINVGAVANDGTGQSLRTAFEAVNNNFANIWAQGPVDSQVVITNNVISTNVSNSPLVLQANGIAEITVTSSVVPSIDSVFDLGSSSKQFDTVWSRYYVGQDGTFSRNLTVGGNLTVQGNIIQVGNIVTETLTIQLANAASTANAANGAGITVGANDDIATILYNSTSNVWNTNVGIKTGNIIIQGDNIMDLAGSNLTNGDLTHGSTSGLSLVPNGSANATTLYNTYGNVAIFASATGANVHTFSFGTNGNMSIPGNLSVVANVAANYFIGNGSQLTGLPAGYANANVVAYGQAGWAGNIIPATSNVYSLGNSTNQWSDLYVSNATIYMNNVPISLTAGNVLTVDGEDVVVTTANGTVNLGNLTVNDYNIYNAAGQGVIISNFSFVDEAETAYVQIPAGNSTSDLNVVQEQGNVRLVANAAVWNFGTDGNVTIPNGGYINFVNTGGITQAVNKDLRFTVSDNEVDGWAIQSTVNDGAGTDLTRMQVRYDGVRINTDLPTNNYNWDFRDTGEFDVPKSIRGPVGGNLVVSIGDQFGSTTFIDLQTRSYVGDALISNIRIGDPNVTVSTASGAYNWTFANTGSMTAPGAINVGDMSIGTVPGDITANANTAVTLNVSGPDGGFAVNYLDEVGNANTSGGELAFSSETGNATYRISLSDDLGDGFATKIWRFDGTGNFNLPSGGSLVGVTSYNSGSIQWLGNSSGDGAGYTTLQLVPDDTLTGNDQYLIIDPTAPGHIHIRAGGTQDNSNADLFLGGENTYFRVYAGANSQAQISANSYNWTFGTDSVLTVPGEGIIRSIQDTVILQSYDINGNTYSARLGTNGGLYFETTAYPLGWLNLTNSSGDANISSPSGSLNIDAANGTSGAAGKDINITAGDADQTDYYTTAGGDVNIQGGMGAFNDGGGGGPGGNINIVAGTSADPAGHAGNITITSGSWNWQFYNNGNLYVPGQINGDNNGNLIIDGAGYGNGYISLPASSFGGEQVVIVNDFSLGNGIALTTNGGTWHFDNAGDLTANGNITGNYFIGNGSQLSAVNANTVDVLNTNGLTTIFYPTFVENRDSAEIVRADVDLTYRTDTNTLGVGNLTVTGLITATGNISGGNILTGGLISSAGNITAANLGNVSALNLNGNASQVLYGNGVFAAVAGGSSYGNANVAANLAAFGSNPISTSGNVTAANFIGNISITGNVTGTSANVTLVAGSYTYTFDNTGVLSLPAVGGMEGGEIHFGIPTANTTLVDSVKIDVYQDRLRFFEGSANTKGAYLDFANCPSGISAAIGYRDIPQISFSANATATGNAAGCHYYSTTAGNLQLTIPDNSNVAFPTGATLTIVMNASGNVIVAQGTGVTLYMAGSSTTGNRTVGAYGLASVMKVAANTWVISGTGVY